MHPLMLCLLHMALLNNNFKSSILESFKTQWSVSQQVSSKIFGGKATFVHGNENKAYLVGLLATMLLNSASTSCPSKYVIRSSNGYS